MSNFWWEQNSAYWELPFYVEMGLTPFANLDDRLAAREQLWAIREWNEEPGDELILVETGA